MKKLSFLFLLMMSMTMVACGNKNETGNEATGFTNNPYTVQEVSGLINVDNYAIQIGAGNGLMIYQPSQQSMQILVDAITLASNQSIPLNGARQLKIRMTASAQNNGAQVGSTQPSYGNTLNVVQAVIYR